VYRYQKAWRQAGVLVAVVAVMLAMLVTAGCGGTPAKGGPEVGQAAAATTAYPLTVTDDAGREVRIAVRPQRIASLTPGNTEIVCALGATDRLVGVTAQCDYPAEVADLAKIGDFAQPNLEAVAAVEPDLVLVTTGIQAEVIERLEALGAVVLAVDPTSLEGLYASIGLVGQVIDEPAAADELVGSIRLQIEDIGERVEGAPATCFLEIAQNPLFTVGAVTLLSDLIEAAGGANVVTEEGYVAYSVEQLIAADPEVYLATLGSMSDPGDLAGRPGYESLTAVTAGRVYVLDDNLVSRPGPRVAEGVRLIAEALHPDVFAE